MLLHNSCEGKALMYAQFSAMVAQPCSDRGDPVHDPQDHFNQMVLL